MDLSVCVAGDQHCVSVERPSLASILAAVGDSLHRKGVPLGDGDFDLRIASGHGAGHMLDDDESLLELSGGDQLELVPSVRCLARQSFGGTTPGAFALHSAAAVGDTALCTRILDAGLGVDDTDSDDDDNDTALSCAVEAGHLSTCRLLLERGADVNRRTDRGATCLDVAVAHGQADVVELLISQGASPDAASAEGTPLMRAARDGFLPVCRVLLRYGCDVNAKGSGNTTPLMCAATSGHAVVTRLLIENGARVNDTDGRGRTALLLAADRGCRHPDLIALLVGRGASVDHKGSDGRTALMIAAGMGSAEKCAVLLEYNASRRLTCSQGMTCADYATGGAKDLLSGSKE